MPNGKLSSGRTATHCFLQGSGIGNGSYMVSLWFRAFVPARHATMGQLRKREEAVRLASHPTELRLGPVYRSKTSLNVKVLDFVKSGGPKWMVGGTIFEMWLGSL